MGRTRVRVYRGGLLIIKWYHCQAQWDNGKRVKKRKRKGYPTSSSSSSSTSSSYLSSIRLKRSRNNTCIPKQSTTKHDSKIDEFEA